MLYRVFANVNGGKSLYALDKVVNKQYENVLIISNELTESKYINRLHTYQTNTNKKVVNKIRVKFISLNASEEILTYIENSIENPFGSDNKYDCILFDGYYQGHFENSQTFNDELTRISNENSIDIITTNNLRREYFDLNFDQKMKQFETLRNELLEGQEYILLHTDRIESKNEENKNLLYSNIYELRNNMIRTFNINQYFPKTVKEEQ